MGWYLLHGLYNLITCFSRSTFQISTSTIFSLQMDPLPNSSALDSNPIMMTFNMVNILLLHKLCIIKFILSRGIKMAHKNGMTLYLMMLCVIFIITR